MNNYGLFGIWKDSRLLASYQSLGAIRQWITLNPSMAVLPEIEFVSYSSSSMKVLHVMEIASPEGLRRIEALKEST